MCLVKKRIVIDLKYNTFNVILVGDNEGYETSISIEGLASFFA